MEDKAVAAGAHVSDSTNASDMARMKAHFESQKRVWIKVPGKGVTTVQINGYTFVIKEGERVEVPEDCAAELVRAERI